MVLGEVVSSDIPVGAVGGCVQVDDICVSDFEESGKFCGGFCCHVGQATPHAMVAQIRLSTTGVW